MNKERGRRARNITPVAVAPRLNREGQRGLNRSHNEPTGCCYEDLCPVTRCRLNLLSPINIPRSRRSVARDCVFLRMTNRDVAVSGSFLLTASIVANA